MFGVCTFTEFLISSWFMHVIVHCGSSLIFSQLLIDFIYWYIMDIQYPGHIYIIHVGKLCHMDAPLKQSLPCDRRGTTLRAPSPGPWRTAGSHPQEQNWSLNPKLVPSPRAVRPGGLNTAAFQSGCRWMLVPCSAFPLWVMVSRGAKWRSRCSWAVWKAGNLALIV